MAKKAVAPEGEPADEGESLTSTPFGAENRARLITAYFEAAKPLTPANAWEHVYRLLLWIDATTSLAHCYESDKSQPGRRWYARSLGFHAWVADQLGVDPNELGGAIDWLFKRVVDDVARGADLAEGRAAERATEQREPFAASRMPEPGLDSEIAELIAHHLQGYLAADPNPEVWRTLTRKLRMQMRLENKRKNLVGEGFEDVIRAIVERVDTKRRLTASTRELIGDIPDFASPGGREKDKRVDLVIINKRSGLRTLLSAKWSVRADREEQLASDYESYARLNKGAPFEYVFLTNEFDAARLIAACDRIHVNHPVFTKVVHIAPEGLLAAYGPDLRHTAAQLPQRLASGRLVSFATWLTELVA